MGMKRTLLLLASMTIAMVLANVAALIAVPAPAEATFPAPTNGKIVFPRFDENADGTRDLEIFTKLPYGTEVQQLTDDELDNESRRTDNEPVYSPDGKKIVWRAEPFLADEEELWAMNVNGSGKMLLATSGQVGKIAFSPDGEQVAYGCSPLFGNNENICTARVDGSGFTNLTKTRDKVEHHFTWSPDGEWLAFVSEQCRNIDCLGEDGANIESSAIFKMRADGSDLTRITPDRLDSETPFQDEQLTWSPDGARIAFVRWIDPPPAFGTIYTAIFTIRPGGSGLTRLTKVYGYEFDPAWSPDGTQLVYSYYTRYGGAVGGLRKMRADGTQEVHLTENPYDHSPMWAPNGKRIAFMRTIPSTYEEAIYTMAPNGSDKRLVVVSDAFYGDYDWQPRP